ncbi:MAG: sensor domain-containing diguanylate cyclase [Ilumatobacteraceae bacterium]
MTRSPTLSAHLLDAPRGPLIGEGRLDRALPFAITAALSMLIAVPTTDWIHPAIAAAGSALGSAMIVAAIVFPWNRVARNAQLTSPFLFLAAILLLASATGNGIGSPFVTMAVLPLMWLAIYEHRAAVLSAAAMTGTGLWLVTTRGHLQVSDLGTVSILVFVVCGAGMGVTLHSLVADARQLTRSLRDHQIALEHAAAMLDALPERVNRYCVSDLAILYCNAAWGAQYNVDPDDAVGRSLEEFLSDDEMDGLHQQVALLGPDNPILVDSVARAVPNAPDQWLEWIDRYLIGPDGPEVLSIGRDVTERHDTEIKLAESEARFRNLADKSADVVWRLIVEPSPHFDYMSPSVERILGYPPSYFLHDFTRMLDILDDEGRSAIARALGGERTLEQYDFHFRHANGSIVIGETRTTNLIGGLQGVSRDVTELRELQDSMAALALRDPLTGMANRRLFNELLDADLARTERNGLPLAVAFLDLDNFKQVNDTYGHDVGDLVLCETAARLVKTVRNTDTVARIGGDEFVIVYEPNDRNSLNLIQRIDRALSQPMHLVPGIVVCCPASIGIAETRKVGYSRAALLAAADEAMYEVKRNRQADPDADDERRQIDVVLSP